MCICKALLLVHIADEGHDQNVVNKHISSCSALFMYDNIIIYNIILLCCPLLICHNSGVQIVFSLQSVFQLLKNKYSEQPSFFCVISF